MISRAPSKPATRRGQAVTPRGGRAPQFSLPAGGRTPHAFGVSKKSAHIAALIASCQGRTQDAHYLGYFVCFNRGEFYEAHDVLEELWLATRTGPNYAFYKGLIQLAGAFVHLQKNRLRPAAALFKLAQTNLQQYPSPHEQLDLVAVLLLIAAWLEELEAGDFERNPLTPTNAPQLALEPA